jgi:hypothetical protein
MTYGPTDSLKKGVSDAADAAWDVAGAVVAVAITSKGIDMIVGDSDSGDGDSEGDGE